MAIRKTTYLYEILIRGSHEGTIAGAHQIMMERIADGDSLLSERPLSPTDLDPAAVRTVLGEAFPAIANELLAARARNAELEAAIPQAAAPAPAFVISDRQFFQGLALHGLCTPQEALEAVRQGILPPRLRAFVDAIEDASERWTAEMLMAGAKEFRRDHPFVEAVGAWAGLDSRALDDFWAECLKL